MSGGADGADEAEGDEERAAVHRGLDPDVAHPAGPVAELVDLLVLAAEQLDEQRPGHVEALGHRGVHRRVEVHLLAGEVLEAAARPAWPGSTKTGSSDERQEREPPLEDEHGDERRDQRR